MVPGGVKEEDQVIRYVADAIVVQFARISKRFIRHVSKCRIMARYANCVDILDVVTAKEKGIVVANVPDYYTEEVSDTAIGHMLSCLRKLSVADHLLRQRIDKWGATCTIK